ncbi:unnamed protein product [Prunus armeniaca]
MCTWRRGRGRPKTGELSHDESTKPSAKCESLVVAVSHGDTLVSRVDFLDPKCLCTVASSDKTMEIGPVSSRLSGHI